MKAKIVRIGNSQGVRIPKPLLDEAGLEGEVELRLVESGIVIERASAARTGWEQAARSVRERGEDGLVDVPTPTQFDEEGWVWE
ncbi:MAG: AbrB/MazE/SpoVT family DNA-binding domain-containing protein [Gemmatimonadota bacterium]